MMTPSRPDPPVSEHVIASISDPGAGPSYSVRALTGALFQQGARVGLRTVAGWRDGVRADPVPTAVPHTAHRQTLAGVPVIGNACLSRDLEHALRKSAHVVDIIHGHGLWLMPNIYPAWATHGTRAKVIVSPRGMLSAEALAFSRLKKEIFWRLFQAGALRRAACLHATSDAEYSDIRAAGIRAPIAVIANGIDLPSLDPTSAPDGSGRNGRRVVLSLGRIHPKKGLVDLVRAWARIEGDHPAWRLRIVGPAELNHDQELIALAESLNLKRVTVEAPAYGGRKLAAYREADLFALPTRNENFAMTVVEALAAGTAVISTKGAPWAGLETEGCGWWIDQGEEPWVAALRIALALPRAELKARGARGRAWMARDYSWDRIAREMLDVYAWVARGGDPPPTVRLG